MFKYYTDRQNFKIGVFCPAHKPQENMEVINKIQIIYEVDQFLKSYMQKYMKHGHSDTMFSELQELGKENAQDIQKTRKLGRPKRDDHKSEPIYKKNLKKVLENMIGIDEQDNLERTNKKFQKNFEKLKQKTFEEKEKVEVQMQIEKVKQTTNWNEVEISYPGFTNKDYKDEEMVKWWESIDKQYFVAPEEQQIQLLQSDPIIKKNVLKPKDNIDTNVALIEEGIKNGQREDLISSLLENDECQDSIQVKNKKYITVLYDLNNRHTFLQNPKSYLAVYELNCEQVKHLNISSVQPGKIVNKYEIVSSRNQSRDKLNQVISDVKTIKQISEHYQQSICNIEDDDSQMLVIEDESVEPIEQIDPKSYQQIYNHQLRLNQIQEIDNTQLLHEVKCQLDFQNEFSYLESVKSEYASIISQDDEIGLLICILVNQYNNLINDKQYNRITENLLKEIQKNLPQSEGNEPKKSALQECKDIQEQQNQSADQKLIQINKKTAQTQQKELVSEHYLEDIAKESDALMDQIRFQRIFKDIFKGIQDKEEYDPKTYFSQCIQRQDGGKKSTKNPNDCKEENQTSVKTENITLETKASDKFNNTEQCSQKFVSGSSLSNENKETIIGDSKLNDCGTRDQFTDSLENNQEGQLQQQNSNERANNVEIALTQQSCTPKPLEQFNEATESGSMQNDQKTSDEILDITVPQNCIYQIDQSEIEQNSSIRKVKSFVNSIMALEFSGNNSTIMMPQLHLNDFSICFFNRWNELNDISTILSLKDVLYKGKQISLIFLSKKSQLELIIYDGRLKSYIVENCLEPNQWYHWVICCKDFHSVQIYKNGKALQAQFIQQTCIEDVYGILAEKNQNSCNKLGNSKFRGMVFEFFIFDYILNDKQISNSAHQYDNLECEQSLTRKQSINYYKLFNKYGTRRRYRKQVEVDCSVCFQDAYTSLNPIIYCQQCQLSVHKFCYGMKKVPKGKFLCDFCTYKRRKEYQNQVIQCELCSVEGMILKLVGQKIWAHPFCLLVNNLLDVKSLDLKQNQVRFQKIEHKLNTNKCALCDKNQGLTIKCCNVNCSNLYFHPLCAYLNGLKLEFDQTNQGIEDSGDFKLQIFCSKHFSHRDSQKQIYYRRYAINYDDICKYQSYEDYKQSVLDIVMM